LRLRSFRDPARHGVSCRKVGFAQTVNAMRSRVTSP
jgi:hypothetical protein